MSTESITISGLRLVYEREGSGPPIVFFHGGNGSVAQWENLVPFLMDDWTCIVVEQRGHGRSDRSPSADYALPALIDEAVAFVESVVRGPAVIVGQSQGGHVACGVAAKRPDLVRAVFSEDALPALATDEIPPFFRTFFSSIGTVARAKASEGLDFYAFANRLAAALPAMAASDPGALVRFARLIQGTDPAWYDVVTSPAFPFTAAQADVIERGVRCPIHVVYGDVALGSLVTEEHVTALRSKGAAITSTHVPGAGHLITPVHAKTVLEALRSFLALV